MLTSLHIQGLAIIDQLNIDFGKGFNVITGETGAGKSILIKALSLLLGAKASAQEVLRTGVDQGVVAGSFSLPAKHPILAQCEERGIPFEVDHGRATILIRRALSLKGRASVWINDTPVTLSVLGELGGALIDIFAQHETHRLLNSAFHTDYVDSLIVDDASLIESQTLAQEIQAELRKIESLVVTYRQRARDRDYLAFRLEELRAFAPSEADYEHMLIVAREAGSKAQIQAGLQLALGCIDQGADGGTALSSPLYEAARALEKLAAVRPEAGEIAVAAKQAALAIDDLSFQLTRLNEQGDESEVDLETAEARLAQYQDLMRKLGVGDIDGLMLEQDRLTEELSFIDTASIEAQNILTSIDGHLSKLETVEKKLAKLRRVSAVTIKSKIESELADLAMKGARLEVEFTDARRAVPAADVGVLGKDFAARWNDALSRFIHMGERAQFLFAANVGEKLQPLERVASGGEVSRIMLALKKVLMMGADACVLVFDEVDTGVSGRVADMVGKKLAQLGSHYQVVCISHLAQVAAYADQHYLVAKAKKGTRTESSIRVLNKDERAEEVARLLSGTNVTSASLSNAKALIKEARS